MAVLKIRKPIRPQDIYVNNVQCNTEQGRSFRINLKGAVTKTTCRCGFEGWVVRASPLAGNLEVRLFNVSGSGQEVEVEIFSEQLEIDEG